ncbi:MAG: reverse transcriptase-like protein [Bdellovibrionales bacterium]|nr:reverse transcriptase-like protein [Bdellovibrionales bacterium]
MSDSMMVLYTDGACSGNPGPGGWGVVMLDPRGEVRELGGFSPHTTNNVMELTATIEGLHAAFADWKGPLEVRTDATYVMKGITEWLPQWVRRGWKTAAGDPVANEVLWRELSELAGKFGSRLRWKKVKGHSGVAGNERADEIAVSYSRGNPASLYRGPADRYRGFQVGDDALHESAPGKPYYLSCVAGRAERHSTWDACRKRVEGVSGARFRKVKSRTEELALLRDWGVSDPVIE